MQPFGSAKLAGTTDQGLTLSLEGGRTCRIDVLDAALLRVVFLRDGRLREPRTWMVAPGGVDVPWEGHDRLDVSAFPGAPFKLTGSAPTLTLATSAVTLRIGLDPLALSWALADGTPFAADRATRPYQASERDGRVRHYMARAATDQYFGLGDKTGALNLHGRRVRTLALDALGYDAASSDPLYKHWPFLLQRDPATGVTFGQLYDSLAPMTFDLGCEYDNYHGFYRYVEIEDGDLDYYVFPGPRIADVVRAFTELTGRMAFGPRWSLGYANTAMSLTDAPDAQARLASFCEEARANDVPISAFHFGSGYTSIGKRRYVFTWNRDKFPEPHAAVERFAHGDMRTVVNLKPCLLDDHPAYAEVAARGAFVRHEGDGTPCIGQFWDGQGAHVDFTHPEGVRWWQEGLTRQVLDYGITAGWNDNNEYEIWDEHGICDGFGTPLPIARARPLQALLMNRATAEAQARHSPGERVFTVTRAGPPGIQRYAQTWSGDNTTSWHSLRWNLRMGLGMSLSGMFNTGHDVGGFFGPVPDPELLIRWAQNGIFSPRFIMNSWKDGGVTNTPWLHPRALPAIRDALRLRYRLMPYLYTRYREAAVDGVPMLRPTFFGFEDDARTFEDRDDFMLGASLLVACVVQPGERTRRVYLPRGPGAWHDFWTGRRYAGGQEIEVEAPLERVPLLVPDGAMIALTDTLDFGRLHDEPSRLLRLFPSRNAGESHETLYEDDGLTLAYRDGGFAQVHFTLRTSSKSVELEARVEGTWTLPYDEIAVALPADERRRLVLRGDGVRLVAGH